MIRYALRCPGGHDFESWFQSAEAYDMLAAQGAVSCPECGAGGVEKALMAPGVQTAAAGPAASAGVAAVAPSLRGPAARREAALAALRRHIEANSDYVGMNFAAEARAMHAGEAPERPIHGEARPEEARALIEEGVPVVPLPFWPARKVN